MDVVTMRIERDSGGQLSIDFLIGVTIFIVAFLFLFVAIPSLFTPFQSDSDKLTMTADRVGNVLMDDTLVYNATEPLPGIVDYARVNAFGAALGGPGGLDTRKSLGLTNNIGVYDLQVLLQLDNNSVVTLSDGGLQPGNQNVGQSRRFVYVRYPGAPQGDPAYYPGRKAILVVRVW